MDFTQESTHIDWIEKTMGENYRETEGFHFTELSNNKNLWN